MVKLTFEFNKAEVAKRGLTEDKILSDVKRTTVSLKHLTVSLRKTEMKHCAQL